MVREIPLTQGRVALVDDEDFERVAERTWSLHFGGSGLLYARHAWTEAGKWHHIKLHRFLLDLPPRHPHVDHRNSDGLDNRRANLRIATAAQNTWNARPTSDTGFKGVWKNRNRFSTSIQRTFLGAYDTAEEAARIYDAAASILYGDFAWTNFPDITASEIDRARRILDGDRTALPPRKRIVRRLTDDDVRDIRHRYAAGGVILAELAAEYDVTDGAIGHALRGHTFAHITDPPPITRDKRGNRRTRKAA